jgi:hypothetical protein
MTISIMDQLTKLRHVPSSSDKGREKEQEKEQACYQHVPVVVLMCPTPSAVITLLLPALELHRVNVWAALLVL